MTNDPSVERGATVVITHRVEEAKHGDYERWLVRIGSACRAAAGHLDWQIIRPIKGLAESYTVVIRFDTVEHLRGWMESAERKALIAEAAPILAADDAYSIHSGLDFWFTPRGGAMKVPVRWKQFVVTWSAIFPLAFLVPLGIVPILRALGVGDVRSLVTLVTTGVIVLLMVYVVMPNYTRLVRRWLYS